MIWSGLLIYWNDSDNPYQHPIEVYRVGIGLGLSFRSLSRLVLANLAGNAPYQITTGPRVTTSSSCGYLRHQRHRLRHSTSLSRELASSWWPTAAHPPRRHPGHPLRPAPHQYARPQSLPAQDQVQRSPAYRLHRPSSSWVPDRWSPASPSTNPPRCTGSPPSCGGYEMARWLHFWLTIGFCGFFVVHVGAGHPGRLEQLPFHGQRTGNSHRVGRRLVLEADGEVLSTEDATGEQSPKTSGRKLSWNEEQAEQGNQAVTTGDFNYVGSTAKAPQDDDRSFVVGGAAAAGWTNGLNYRVVDERRPRLQLTTAAGRPTPQGVTS